MFFLKRCYRMGNWYFDNGNFFFLHVKEYIEGLNENLILQTLFSTYDTEIHAADKEEAIYWCLGVFIFEKVLIVFGRPHSKKWWLKINICEIRGHNTPSWTVIKSHEIFNCFCYISVYPSKGNAGIISRRTIRSLNLELQNWTHQLQGIKIGVVARSDVWYQFSENLYGFFRTAKKKPGPKKGFAEE